MASEGATYFSSLARFIFVIFLCLSLDQEMRVQGSVFSQPISTQAPSFRNATHSLKPTGLWGAGLRRPYPTNSFFTNLILNQGTSRIGVEPYQIDMNDDNKGLSISFATVKAFQGYIFAPFTADITLEVAEAVTKRTVSSYDTLSATVKFDEGLMVPLVLGSPYVTGVYTTRTPVLKTVHSISSVNGQTQPGTVSGTKFELVMNNGHTWVVYASSQISFQWTRKQLTATAKYSGYLRAAYSTGSAMEAILDSHKAVYPTGGSVSYEVANDRATIQFTFKTSDPSNTKLLMVALPHHVEILENTVTLLDAYRTLRGSVSFIEGNVWTMTEVLPTTTWFAPTPIDPSKKNAILEALRADQRAQMTAQDPYFFGKNVARNARLALIADQLNQTQIATSIRTDMKNALNTWLEGRNTNPLLYDTTWGGICSDRGMKNFGADFGNGLYNDHHFHYGYHIYAAAVIAKEDPAWAATYGNRVNDLVRDFANPSTQDPFFPVTRTKDWYAGHSWASGITQFGDSKNQESTSESINGYYAVWLWGIASKNKMIEDLGRVMLATEIRSTRKYWHMTTESSVYPKPFADNKVVGIVWTTKADYGTWFGANVEFIHCIQMLPFTPITEDYLERSWITEEYPILATSLTRSTPALSEDWRGYVYMAHAIIDSAAAWNEVNRLTRFDNGNTKTNTLYWVATRPRPNLNSACETN